MMMAVPGDCRIAALGLASWLNLQIDGGVNIGLNRATPDVQLYTGLAAKF